VAIYCTLFTLIEPEWSTICFTLGQIKSGICYNTPPLFKRL